MRFSTQIAVAIGFLGAAVSSLPCRQEMNTDYVGFDIANKPGSLSDCCSLCSRTDGCAAWSWSSYLGGTCWLKSRLDKRVPAQGVTSGYAYNYDACPISDNVDYIGNDIANVPSSFAGRCCMLCESHPGCGAFSWTNYQGGTCWLKSHKGATSWNPNVKSGVLTGTTSPPFDCALVVNVDYVGNDVGHVHAPNAGACCDICWKRDDCRAFSWSNYRGGTCWLKSVATKKIPREGVISSIVKGLSCKYESEVDYVNYDIGKADRGNVSDCCSACASYHGCTAFSWSEYNGGTCWLKSKIGDVVSNANVSSGSIA